MYQKNTSKKISKILSKNDSGETGGHQAGILVPKDRRILEFFPPLDSHEKNPRVHILFKDDAEKEWIFAFIYYNNCFFGGTRNEYRLTRMTSYMRLNNLREGDELVFYHDDNGDRRVTFNRTRKSGLIEDGVLRIGKNWKVINF